MEIKKESRVLESGAPTPEQMTAINALAKGKLSQEQVYVFSLRLCDDRVDRDLERFDTRALPGLAKLFVGKTGVVDHQWSADKQIARVFATEVVKEEGSSYLKGWAYIRRSEKNADIIADIEAGIKKEVSIGCAMGKAVCSVCGGEYGACGHQKGEYYDGAQCHVILRQPVDAYEFSFVAVPAQREAGVLKAMGGRKAVLKELAEEFGAQEEYRALKELAKLGQCYRGELEDDVVRLGLALELGAAEPVLRSLAGTAKNEDLRKLREALGERFQAMMPVTTQLGHGSRAETGVESGFLI